jgi:uncharacterized protein (DUF1800 family)
MELFALGIGNYTEQDVREASRAFTGWSVPKIRMERGQRSLGEPVFRQQRYDNGTKRFLGQTGNFGPDEIVDIITSQQASGEHIRHDMPLRCCGKKCCLRKSRKNTTKHSKRWPTA